MKAKVIPIKSRLFKINKVTKKRQRLSDNGFRDLGYVIRANDRSRYLSEKAQKIATNLHKMMQKHPTKQTFIDQAFLSNITKITTSGGNANIMWQLDDIFVRDYHDAVYFDGQKNRWGYIVSYTEDGEERMQNPSKFYKMDSLFRPDTNSDAGANKLRPRSQKNLTLSIYKELIEDISYRDISSINEESATEESFSSSQTEFSETTPVAAMPIGGSSTGEFLPHSPDSQASEPVELAKTVKPRLVITAAMQQGTTPMPSLVQARGLAMEEVNTTTARTTRPPIPTPVMPLPSVEQERDRSRAHQTRRQGTVSNEPKLVGATILSLLPKLNLEANHVTNTRQKWKDFQLEVENFKACSTSEPITEPKVTEEYHAETEPKTECLTTQSELEGKPNEAEKAKRAAIWQGLLSGVAELMGEIHNPLSGKMRKVTLEDMLGQFGNMNYKVDLELKRIRLQAKTELWIPAFELTYSVKFKDAAVEAGYSFELVRTFGEKL